MSTGSIGSRIPIEAERKRVSRHFESLRPGTRINQFKVIRLQQSGMGQVYLARDTQLGHKVALKLIRFRRAPTAPQLDHPNIVAVYAVGEHEGQPYLALEPLKGQSLRQRQKESSFAFQDKLRIARDIASALVEAHANNTLHLDLKPDSVLITPEGRTKVFDFGLCRPDDLEPPEPPLQGTLSSIPLMTGTPTYMAPEQWQKERRTTATDIWAFGVLLYELFEGKRPWKTSSSHIEALGQEICRGTPQPLSKDFQMPEALGAVVSACLTKDPTGRPTANALFEQFEAAMTGPPPRAEGQNPFCGLRSFTSAHANLFFGRDQEIADIVERLRTEPLLTVMGASGVGKSSLIRAGIVPHLADRGDLTVITMRPGANPFRSLARQILDRAAASDVSLSPRVELDIELVQSLTHEHPQRLSLVLDHIIEVDGGQVLLIVDQLEELYTMVKDPEIRRAFMKAVTLAADDAEDPVRILFVVRDDFLARVGETSPQVFNGIRRVLILQVPEPTALTNALTKPAEIMGHRFEDPTLVDAIVEAVNGTPSELPVLQLTAQRLWERRDQERKLLTRHAFDDIRGNSGVLATHTDGLLDALTDLEVDFAKTMLLRMVNPDDTRCIIERDRILDGLPPEAEPILHRLIEADLISHLRNNDEGPAALELTHESLVVTWPRLRMWLEQRRQSFHVSKALERAAHRWEKRGQRHEDAWTASALTEAEFALSNERGPISARVTAFLKAGRERERRRQFRRRVAEGLVFFTLLVALVLSVSERQDAVHHGTQAENRRAEAEREGASAALAHGDVFEARAKLRSSLETQDSVLARALWSQLAEDPLLWSNSLPHTVRQVVLHPKSGRILVRALEPWLYEIDAKNRKKSLRRIVKSSIMAVSPNGRWLALGLRSGAVEIWDHAEHRRIHHMEGHDRPPLSLEFGPDGRTLYSGDFQGRFIAWHVDTGTTAKVMQTAGEPLRDLVVSASGTWGISVGSHHLRRWDLENGRMTALWPHDSYVNGVALSPDGTTLASIGDQQDIRLWSTATQTLIRRIPTPNLPVAVLFNHDGTRVIASGPNGAISIYDVETRQEVSRLLGHEGEVTTLAIAPEGSFLVSGSEDNTVRLWDLNVDAPVPDLPPHVSGINGMAFSPDGKRLATASADQTIRIWDVENGTATHRFGEKEGAAYAVDFSPDGQSIVWSGDTVRMASLTIGAQSVLLQGRGPGPARTVKLIDEGKKLITTTGGQLAVYDVAAQHLLQKWEGHPYDIQALAVAPDGRTVATASLDRTVKLWDAIDGRLVETLPHDWVAFGVAFDDSGRALASSTMDGSLYHWNLDDGTKTTVGKLRKLTFFLDLSKDGRYLISSGQDHQARVWDVKKRRVLHPLPGHHGEVIAVALSPDDRFVASAGLDATVRLYDRKTGRPMWHAPAWLHAQQAARLNGRWQRFDDRPWTSSRWLSAIEAEAQWAVDDPTTTWGCLARFDQHIEVWNLTEDRSIVRLPSGSVDHILATRRGCVAQSENRAWWIPFESPVLQPLTTEAVRAMAVHEDRIVIATDRDILLFDMRGRLTDRIEAPDGITAVALSYDKLLIGRDSGQLAYLPLNNTEPSSLVVLDTMMTSAVSRLMTGPFHTLMAGGENGDVGLWNLETGKSLRRDRLHGAIVHLVRKGPHTYAISELGGYTHWDLAHFEEDYCTLLEDVWSKVEVSWTAGHPKVTPPPRKHACANRK